MSQRHYLLNTTVLSSDCVTLDDAVQNKGATTVEVAEAVYRIPLPWFACFRQSDLQPCTVQWEESDSMEIMVPCVGLPTAVQNLTDSLPLFEKLTGEKKYSHEYWQCAIEDIKKLPLPFVTMDVSEMLMNMHPEELTTAMTSSLSGTDEALNTMKSVFLEYHGGALPYDRDAFYAGRYVADDRRIANTVALDAAIQENGFVRRGRL